MPRAVTLIILSLLLAGLACPAVLAQDSTATLSGTVFDDDTGEPLPGVNVYLAETTNGASTGTDGRFSFVTAKRGSYRLVFSMTGYERRIRPLILDGSDRQFEARLTPHTYEMNPLRVEGSNRAWKENLAIFKREFIGTGSYARQTRILNPLILDFERDPTNGDLLASSPEPLIVENRALGYRIHLELDAFNFDNLGQYGFYRIYPWFTELEAPDAETHRCWERNRERAYQGSLKHFLRSLYDERVYENGFDVHSIHDLVPLTRKETEFAMLGQEGVSKELADELRGYRLHREVEVVHGAKTGYLLMRGGDTFSVIRSMIFPDNPQRRFFIDSGGNLLEPTSISIQGDWSTHRLAHRLPLEFGK